MSNDKSPQDPPIFAALSPKEWALEAERTEEQTWNRIRHFALYGMRQQAAALCLYQQPYGFTRAEYEAVTVRADARTDEEHALAQRCFAKIAALLPPPSP